MGPEKQTADDIRWNLAEQLDWRFAERNDVAVAHALQRGEPVDAVHTLDEAGLLDGFFVKIVKIQEHESPYLPELVQQAQANLAPFSRIRWLVADRAYLDGPTLYALDQMGITFIVIAKSNMVARRTVLALSAKSPLQRRVETVHHGHGRQAWTEEKFTCVQAVTGIRSWRSYRPPVVQGAV